MDKNHPLFKDVDKNHPLFQDMFAALWSAQPREKPVAVLIDSNLDMPQMRREAAHELVNSGRAVTVVPDRARELMGYDKAQAAQFTDAEKWNDLLIKAAVAEKCNLVITDRLKDREQAVQMAQFLKENGYTLEIRARAVGSDLGYAQERLLYEREIHDFAKSDATLKTREEYDQERKALGETLVALDPYTDKAKLYNNEGNIYENHRIDGEWLKQPGLSTAYYNETSRPPSTNDLHEQMTALKGIFGLTRKREGVSEGVGYAVGTEKGQGVHCEGAKEAFEKFKAIDSGEKPYIDRVFYGETARAASLRPVRIAHTDENYKKIVQDAYLQHIRDLKKDGPNDLLALEDKLRKTQDTIRLMAPQHNQDKDQAQLHVIASSNRAQNVEALKQYPALAGLPEKDLDRLAYWRGVVRETMRNEARPSQEAALNKFDKAATDNPSQFLAKFDSKPQQTATERTRTKSSDLSL